MALKNLAVWNGNVAIAANGADPACGAACGASDKGYVIGEDCIGCDACQTVCPQGIISEGTPYVIDADHCLQCGNCAENCPVEAIRRL